MNLLRTLGRSLVSKKILTSIEELHDQLGEVEAPVRLSKLYQEELSRHSVDSIRSLNGKQLDPLQRFSKLFIQSYELVEHHNQVQIKMLHVLVTLIDHRQYKEYYSFIETLVLHLFKQAESIEPYKFSTILYAAARFKVIPAIGLVPVLIKRHQVAFDKLPFLPKKSILYSLTRMKLSSDFVNSECIKLLQFSYKQMDEQLLFNIIEHLVSSSAISADFFKGTPVIEEQLLSSLKNHKVYKKPINRLPKIAAIFIRMRYFDSPFLLKYVETGQDSSINTFALYVCHLFLGEKSVEFAKLNQLVGKKFISLDILREYLQQQQPSDRKFNQNHSKLVAGYIKRARPDLTIELEACIDIFPVDILIPQKKLVIEVTSNLSYLRCYNQQEGSNLVEVEQLRFRRECLAKKGFRVVQVQGFQSDFQAILAQIS